MKATVQKQSAIPALATGIILLFLAAGCGGPDDQRAAAGKAGTVVAIPASELQPFLTFEEDSIAGPADLALLPDGAVAVLDYKLNKVLVYSAGGRRRIAFGKEGKGPGEFTRPVHIQQVGGHLYVGDQGQQVWQKFSPSGTFLETIRSDESTLSFQDIQLMDGLSFLVPANGRQNSLLIYKKGTDDQPLYFGKSMGDSTAKVVNFQKNIQQAKNDEVPDLFKNMVHLGYDEHHFYAFLKSYGRLQQYDRSGQLQWESRLDLPFMQRLYEEFVEENKDGDPRSLRMLLYAYDMEITGNALYLLMNMPEGEKQALLKLDKEGTILKQYRLDYPDGRFNGLAVASGQKAYLVDTSMGRVMTLELP